MRTARSRRMRERDGRRHREPRDPDGRHRRRLYRLRGLAGLGAVHQGGRVRMMATRTCAECAGLYKPLRRGLCSPCYLRKARREPGVFVRQHQTAVALLEDRSMPEPNSGCTLFIGRLSSDGYGQLYAEGSDHLAHRIAYQTYAGRIPDGLQLDHLCRNRACVNPMHLEPVTSRTNTLRGIGPAARNARLTECQRGHAFTPANTYVDPKGRRGCRLCRSLAQARYRMQQGAPCQL